jgi:hypothetical protein
VSVVLVAEPEMNARPADESADDVSWTSWLPAGPTTARIFDVDANRCATLIA